MMKYNYKMQISLNDRKIDVNQAELIIRKITELSVAKDFKTIQSSYSVSISGTGLPNDYANMGSLISLLKRQKWFMDNIQEWLFYDSENGMENLIRRYSWGNILWN